MLIWFYFIFVCPQSSRKLDKIVCQRICTHNIDYATNGTMYLEKKVAILLSRAKLQDDQIKQKQLYAMLAPLFISTVIVPKFGFDIFYIYKRLVNAKKFLNFNLVEYFLPN